MNTRYALGTMRVRARVGGISETADNVATTTTTMIWLIGLGGLAYIFFGFVAPTMLGGATKTKRAYREFKEAGGGRETGGGHYSPPDEDDEDVYDAEFTQSPPAPRIAGTDRSVITPPPPSRKLFAR